MTLEEPPQCAPAAANSRFAQRREQFLEGGSWLFFNKRQYQCRVFLQPGCAPPRGFGAVLPVSRQCCHHLTAVLIAIPKSSAASCRDTPDATASITRLRKSAE
jgi:hypothetical protein